MSKDKKAQVQKWVVKWKRRLGLGHYRHTFGFSSPAENHDLKDAEATIDISRRSFHITLDRTDMARVTEPLILHELLHVVLFCYTNAVEKLIVRCVPKTKQESHTDKFALYEEKLVDEMVKIFMNMDRSSNGN